MSDDTKKPETIKDADVVIEFPLQHPIIAYGEEVKALKLRKPNGSDLLRVGNPVKFSPFTKPPTVEHDFPRVIEMAARLSGIPSSSIEKLDPQELVALAWEMSPFFIPTL